MLVESYILPFSDKVRAQYKYQDNKLSATNTWYIW